MRRNILFIRAMVGYFLTVLVIEIIDILLGSQISLWVLLLLPVGLATWNLGLRSGVVIACVSVLALLLQGLVFGSPFNAVPYLLISITSKAVAISVIAWLVDKLREQEVKRVYFKKST